MRVMLMIKGDPEPGARPSEELLAAMQRYNDELTVAGVLVDLAGLYPSGEGKRVRFSGGERTVDDGPFGEKDSVVRPATVFVAASRDLANPQGPPLSCRNGTGQRVLVGHAARMQ
jgi:hypothetical protein